MDKFAEVDPSTLQQVQGRTESNRSATSSGLRIDFAKLSKKERKKLKREIERREEKKKGKRATIVKLLLIVLLLMALGVGGWFGYKELSKPLPGQQFVDQGRNHVPKEEWEKFAYNSNPPTSGPHDAAWVKAGVFSTPQPEGQLVHSLEHGYIVISYNCNSGISNFQFPISNEATGSAEATSSSDATASSSLKPLSQQECDSLKKQLSDLANDKRLWKLIVVPRSNLDTRIAVTAWTKLDKMDGFDKDRIAVFIDARRNHGPEQTME